MDKRALARVYKARKKAGKVGRWGVMPQPDGVRRNYFTALRRGPLAYAKQLVNDRLIPKLESLAEHAQKSAIARADAKHANERLGVIMDSIRDHHAEKYTRENYAKIARNAAVEAEKFHGRAFNANAKKVFGIDVLGNEPWLKRALGEFVGENVSLIKSIPASYFDEIEKRVSSALANGERASTMVDEIQERYKVSESRANLIARDQIGKLNGDLNQLRMLDLGIESYTWRTMHDNRVRETHSERDGNVYKWNDPPGDLSDPGDGGNPGEPICCRCFADPILDGLLSE